VREVQLDQFLHARHDEPVLARDADVLGADRAGGSVGEVQAALGELARHDGAHRIEEEVQHDLGRLVDLHRGAGVDGLRFLGTRSEHRPSVGEGPASCRRTPQSGAARVLAPPGDLVHYGVIRPLLGKGERHECDRV
jgi:hypothetical protein